MASSASFVDDILIRAGMRASYNKKYHCEKEIDTLDKRINDKRAKEEYKKALKEKKALRAKIKGCGFVVSHVVDAIGDVIFKTCLCKLKHPMLYDLIFMSENMDKGILPYGGSLMDQPARMVELIRITKDAMAKEEFELSKKAKEKNVKHRH